MERSITMTTTTTLNSVPDIAVLTAATSLQRLLPQLVALTLDAKQSHWNVTGPGFLPLHAFTDELASEARLWADRVAERAVALGSPVDGRPATVASLDTDPLPSGWLSDYEVISELTRRINDVTEVVRDSLEVLGDADAVAHGIAIDVLEGLEKFLWMLRATG